MKPIKGIKCDCEKEEGVCFAYLEFELTMSPEWAERNYRSKDRFLDQFNRTHASDAYQGNIDYTVQAGNFKGNKVGGEIILRLPVDWAKDWDKDDVIECAEDAVGETLKYEFSHSDQNMVEEIEVIA